MRNVFLLFLAISLSFGCGEETKESNKQSPESTNSTETGVKTQKKEFEKPKQFHPCDLIELNTMAKMLDLDVSKMRARRENMGNGVCIVSTSELAKAGKEQDIFFFNLLINSNGQEEYAQGISNMLAEGSLEIPAGPDKGKFKSLREVQDLGGKAFVYSAAHFSALIFEKNNQYRYTMTLYKDVPDSDIFNGLSEDSQQLEEWLIEMARSI